MTVTVSVAHGGVNHVNHCHDVHKHTKSKTVGHVGAVKKARQESRH